MNLPISAGAELFESCYVGRDFVEVFLDEAGVEGLLEVRRHLRSLAWKETIVCAGKGQGGSLEGTLVFVHAV